MATHIRDYKDLIGVLLGPVRERPAMYLGEAKISKLQNFINGYHICFMVTKKSENDFDSYFNNPGFFDWYYDKYNVKRTAIWADPFLKEAQGDEVIALELFFKYLDEYSKVIADT